MSWLPLVPALGVALLVLLVPGLLVTLAARLRGIDAFATAPAVSVGLTAVAAILAPALGLRWALWIPFAAAVPTALVVLLLTLLLRRLRLADLPRPRAAGAASAAADRDGARRAPWARALRTAPEMAEFAPASWFSREQAAWWGAFLIGGALMLRNLKNSLGQPGWFSQTFDASFHLNAIRWIAETGNASSTALTTMTSGGKTPDFYPAAWHDVVSLVFMATGCTVPEATNAVVLVAGAVVWPLSILFLLRSMGRFSLPVVLAAGSVLAGFVAFPLLLMDFGVLYPNYLGLILLPAVLGLVLNLFRVGTVRRTDTAQAVLLGVPSGLGLALAHPNAMMSLLVMALPVLVVRGIRQVRAALAGRVRWWAAAVQALLVLAAWWFVCWFLWGIVRPPASASDWPPGGSDAQAWGEALLNNPIGRYTAQWTLSVLVVVGAVAVLRTRRHVWLLGTYGVVLYYYVCVRWLNFDQDRTWITGVWYNDAYRLAALLPLAGIPLAVVGVQWLLDLLTASPAWAALARRAERRRLAGRRVSAPALLAVATGLVALVVTQSSGPLHRQVEDSFWSYAADADARLVSADELDVLQHVDQYVPAGQTVVVDPWTGGTLVYALADRKASMMHTYANPTPEVAYLNTHLDRARTDPKVCRDLKAIDAQYVLYFGNLEVNLQDHTGAYSGIRNIPFAGASTAQTVYQKGGAGLLKITACG